MRCPYCNGTKDFMNKSITYKYHHSCKKHFKVCPVCDTKYVTENNYSDTQCVIVENILQVDFCEVCNNAWLPDFPLSWTRSFTNLSKIYEIIEDIYKNSERHINAKNLYRIQRSHYGVIFNPERAMQRGAEAYISGQGNRRMSEYLNVLKNMGILRIKSYDKQINHELTKLGEEIVKTDTSLDLLTYFIISYLNIKLNNGYQRKQRNSSYRFFKIRFAENLLKIINYLNDKGEGASIYQVALSVLVRNDEQFEKYCIGHIENFSSISLRKMFFEGTTELNRAVKSTFLNVFISMGIILEDNNYYYITELGTKLLRFLQLRPAIWFEDIVKYAENIDRKQEEVFALLLLWRLVKNNILSDDEINISIEELNNKVADIIGQSVFEIKDIHVNLFYDEPVYKPTFNFTETIIEEIKKQLKNSKEINNEEIIELCSLLTVSWYDDIYSLVSKQESESITNFVSSTSDALKENMQSGREWHNKSKSFFIELGFQTVDYRESPYFEGIIIERLNLMLPGATVHNPDMILLVDGYGPQNCILVDAKDENSINGELPKLIGYSWYSSDSRVDTFTIISLRGNLPDITKRRIESSIQEFDRITIIEEGALESLIDRGLSNKQIIDLLDSRSGFKLITEKNY